MTRLLLRLWLSFAVVTGCACGSETNGEVTDGPAMDGEATDGPDTDGEPEQPGSRLEIFGPSGMGHQPPRRHDFGPIVLGESRTATIVIWNFGGDPWATIVALDWPEELNPEGHDGLRLASDAPSVGDDLGYQHTYVPVVFAPTVAGFRQAVLRLSIDHDYGYYDFVFAGEGVAPGEAPAPFDGTCLEDDRTVDVGAVEAGVPRDIWVFLPVLCTYEFGSAHLAIDAVTITSGAEFYSFQVFDDPSSLPPEEACAPAYLPCVPNGSSGLSLPSIPMVLAAPGVGTYEAELSIHANDAVGSYTLRLVGTVE